MSIEDFRRLIEPETSLVEFLRLSPLSDIELDFEPSRDPDRGVNL